MCRHIWVRASGWWEDFMICVKCSSRVRRTTNASKEMRKPGASTT